MSRPPGVQHVLIATPHYPPHSIGGTQLRAQRMAQGLTRRGVRVDVVCVEHITKGTSDQLVSIHTETRDNVMVHRLSLHHTLGAVGLRHSYDHGGIWQYTSELAGRIQPDVIHLISGYLITPAAISVASKLGIPSVVTVTDYWFVCPRINLIRSDGRACSGPESAIDCTRCLMSESRRYRLPERALPALANFAWRRAATTPLLMKHLPLCDEIERRSVFLRDLLNSTTSIVIPTNSLRSALLKLGARDRFRLIRHSVDRNASGIGEMRSTKSVATIRFGFMGNLIPSKGIETLLEAYALLRRDRQSISLEIWGTPPTDAKFKRRIDQLLATAPGAVVHGRYSPGDVGQILAGIDVLIVPSRWPEIGPYVVLEAFAAGVPVIASALGNMVELVQHDANGLLFSPDSPADLAAQMRRCIDEPELIPRLCARITAPPHPDQEESALIALYGELANTGSAAAVTRPNQTVSS